MFVSIKCLKTMQLTLLAILQGGKKKRLSIRFNVKPAGHMCFNVIMSYILHVRKN